ncbi:DUF427 domain-containing protein [Cryobacterium psychrophilum]|uniref:DUF427 domain-containing protein n=1 Tax=Cryobacterium psychrophilum TaxID=41988 RepID=A0A4Y8KS25_9MICO|nr:DUF427 domain-containing protein [Cryobacterium psychrophilum]TDW28762.1 nucleotidyltransferase-like protein [Cryobacterium psychrophilum]TFD82414.1 DUF427 domain-containing protein [Cryobacterium psychrophilum]
MKAVLNGTVLAEAARDELIKIEGNWYFPPQSVNAVLLVTSPTPYTCAWKGDCQYFSVTDGANILQDGAFSYPEPYPASLERVGRDFSKYVAFSRDFQITE